MWTSAAVVTRWSRQVVLLHYFCVFFCERYFISQPVRSHLWNQLSCRNFLFTSMWQFPQKEEKFNKSKQTWISLVLRDGKAPVTQRHIDDLCDCQWSVSRTCCLIVIQLFNRMTGRTTVTSQGHQSCWSPAASELQVCFHAGHWANWIKPLNTQRIHSTCSQKYTSLSVRLSVCSWLMFTVF